MKNHINTFVKTNIGPSTPIKYEVSKSLMGGIILKHKVKKSILQSQTRIYEESI